MPDEKGKGQESRARTSKGYKKLDVNYSTIQLGLALGISIKTINFADASTGRFTKNYTRNQNELRAEATDYHKRQPWSILVAVVFLPISSCDDANSRTEQGASSFGAAVQSFRQIAGRVSPQHGIDLFERVFIALYDESAATIFFDVENAPPKKRRPTVEEALDFPALLKEIVAIYDARNSPPFLWADDPEPEVEALELPDEPED